MRTNTIWQNSVVSCLASKKDELSQNVLSAYVDYSEVMMYCLERSVNLQFIFCISYTTLFVILFAFMCLSLITEKRWQHSKRSYQ